MPYRALHAPTDRVVLDTSVAISDFPLLSWQQDQRLQRQLVFQDPKLADRVFAATRLILVFSCSLCELLIERWQAIQYRFGPFEVLTALPPGAQVLLACIAMYAVCISPVFLTLRHYRLKVAALHSATPAGARCSLMALPEGLLCRAGIGLARLIPYSAIKRVVLAPRFVLFGGEGIPDVAVPLSAFRSRALAAIFANLLARASDVSLTKFAGR